LIAAYLVRSVCIIDLDTVEEEADSAAILALTLAESAHQLVQFGRPLDLEEHLVVVISDLDVEVFAASVLLLSAVGGLLVVGHRECAYMWSKA
jgi:hypothetical protein